MNDREREAVINILADNIADEIGDSFCSREIAKNGYSFPGTANMSDEELLAELERRDLSVADCVEQYEHYQLEPVKLDTSLLPEDLIDLMEHKRSHTVKGYLPGILDETSLCRFEYLDEGDMRDGCMYTCLDVKDHNGELMVVHESEIRFVDQLDEIPDDDTLYIRPLNNGDIMFCDKLYTETDRLHLTADYIKYRGKYYIPA